MISTLWVPPGPGAFHHSFGAFLVLPERLKEGASGGFSESIFGAEFTVCLVGSPGAFRTELLAGRLSRTLLYTVILDFILTRSIEFQGDSVFKCNLCRIIRLHASLCRLIKSDIPRNNHSYGQEIPEHVGFAVFRISHHYGFTTAEVQLPSIFFGKRVPSFRPKYSNLSETGMEIVQKHKRRLSRWNRSTRDLLRICTATLKASSQNRLEICF